MDLLRFFAALMVVIFHLNEPILYIDNWYRSLAKFGWLGVPVFFVISGYCILLSAYHSKNSLQFIIRRFFRIFPTYWFSLVLVLIVALLQKLMTGDNSVVNIPKSFSGIIATLTLFTKPVSGIETVNWVYWSLSCELFFYLVVALIMSLYKKIWLPLLLAVSVLAVSFPDQANGLLFFLNYWPAFALGVGIYVLHFSPSKMKWFYFIAFTLISIGDLLSRLKQAPDYEFLITTVITATIVLISPYLKLKKNFFSSLGDHSYSIYLIHVPIGIFLLGRLETKIIQTNLFFNMLYDISMYIFLSLLSYLMFKYVEQNAIKFGKGIIIKLNYKKDCEVTSKPNQ